MDELVTHASDHSPGDGWVARSKPLWQALDSFTEDKQLVQNCRLRLEVIQESKFVERPFERDR